MYLSLLGGLVNTLWLSRAKQPGLLRSSAARQALQHYSTTALKHLSTASAKAQQHNSTTALKHYSTASTTAPQQASQCCGVVPFVLSFVGNVHKRHSSSFRRFGTPCFLSKTQSEHGPEDTVGSVLRQSELKCFIANGWSCCFVKPRFLVVLLFPCFSAARSIGLWLL